MTARTTRRYHVFIKISFCDGIRQSILGFSRKPGFSFFCTANSFHHELMLWLEGAEVEGSYFKQKLRLWSIYIGPWLAWGKKMLDLDVLLTRVIQVRTGQAWLAGFAPGLLGQGG